MRGRMGRPQLQLFFGGALGLELVLFLLTPSDLVFERVLISRIFLITSLGTIATLAILNFSKTQNLLKDFFLSERSAFNLSIARIIIFSLALAFTRMPWIGNEELIQWPKFAYWIYQILPLNVEFARTAYWIFFGTCLASIVGFCTRSSTILTAMLALYLWGIPNLYGKVGHGNQALIVPLFILALAPCGKMFSIDAIRKSWRSFFSSEEKSMAYGVPLRLIWLNMSAFYFFPGFWKIWTSGFDWASSENQKLTLYFALFNNNRAPHSLRVDHLPLLLLLGGCFVLLFEVGFPFLVLFKRGRIAAWLAGISFHTFTKMFLNISFSQLKSIYFVLVDWELIVQKLWPRQYPKEIPANHSVSIVGVYSVALICFAANIYMGILHTSRGWPFSCFPRFDTMQVSTVVAGLKFEAFDGSSKTVDVDRAVKQLESKMGRDAWFWKQRAVGEGSQDRFKKEALVLWRQIETLDPKLSVAKKVKVYRVWNSIIPEDKKNNPTSIKDMVEISLGSVEPLVGSVKPFEPATQ